MKFSRKTFLAVIGLLTVIAAFFQQQFGLTIDSTAVIGGLGVIVLYLLLEAKLDFKRIVSQADRFKDPKFWIAFVTALIPAIEAFGVNLPAETIVSALTILMSILFGKDFKKVNA